MTTCLLARSGKPTLHCGVNYHCGLFHRGRCRGLSACTATGLGGMTLKTIHSNARKGVTTLAELTLAIDRNELALFVFINVTIDAVHQTVLPGADSLMHGFVALMQQELHVIPPHHIRRFNALLQFHRLGIAISFPIDMDAVFVRKGMRRKHQ